jgi:hypothetical protein
MKRILRLLLLLAVLSSCATPANCSDPQDNACTRVLFLGNSYTFVNDLPNTFASLARSGGYKVEVDMSAQGGWTLANHLQSPESLDAIQSKAWDFVVLQEQSQIPAVELSRTQAMYPAARELVRRIRQQGASPVFFITWAHRGGFPENGMNDYASMQAQINAGYSAIAQELGARIAPVGSAWQTAVDGHPELELWQADGIHPTEQGTYLAACVFYAAIFHESPRGLRYRAGLPKATAETLQTLASQAVLQTP